MLLRTIRNKKQCDGVFSLAGLLAGLCLVALMVLPLQAQQQGGGGAGGDERDQLAREITARVAELSDLQQARASERERTAERMQRLASTEAELDRLTAETQARMAELNQKLADLQQQRLQVDQRIIREEATVEAVAAEARQISDEAMNWLAVSRGRWEASTRDDLAALRGDLDEDRSAGIASLLGWYGEQIQRGRQRTIENRQVQLDSDRVIHAWVLQLGSVHRSFVSEDGQIIGLADERVAEGWRIGGAGAFTEGEAAAIRAASAISRGEQPAGVVILPIIRSDLSQSPDATAPAGGQGDD